MRHKTRIEKECKVCHKKYEVIFCRRNKTKTCSKVCHNSMAGKLGGKAGKGVSRNLGAKHPWLIDRNKTKWMKSFITGNSSKKWKGDKVGYGALHAWIRNNYGQPKTCEHCLKDFSSNYKIHWANKTGKYKRDREDWLRLCCKCHRLFDNRFRLNKKIFKNHKRLCS